MLRQRYFTRKFPRLTLFGLFVLLVTVICCTCPTLAQQLPTNVQPGMVQSNAGSGDNGTAKQVTNPAPSQADSAAADQRGAESVLRGKTTQQAYLTFKTPYEFWLTGLAIALVVVMAAMLCLMAALGALTPEFYKAFLILVVVFAALFLIVAGYTDQQTAPVFSLLGTIAGYIFGRSSNSDPANPPKPPPADDKQPDNKQQSDAKSIKQRSEGEPQEG